MSKKMRKSVDALAKAKQVQDEAQKKIEQMELKKKQEEDALRKKVEEAGEAAKKAALEEQQMVEDTRKKIEGIAEENGLFCGVVLTQEDLLKIFEMAMVTKEHIKIPFQLYFSD
jgi:hypothetical protein